MYFALEDPKSFFLRVSYLREQRYFSQHYGKYMFSNQKKLLMTGAFRSVICMIKICNTHIITIKNNYLLGTLDIWDF